MAAPTMDDPTGVVSAEFEDEEINCLWTAGLTGQGLGLSTEPTQKSYQQGDDLGSFSSLYTVGHEPLGQGTFGVVSVCHHKRSDTKCVVKCVSKTAFDHSYFEEHLDRDMFTLLLKMSHKCHPNVVRYLDFLMGPKTVYVIMEPLDGEELLVALTHRAVSSTFCREVMRQSLSALEYIHSLGIIHRDVKLDAFRFRNSSQASELVLFDFGHCCHDSNSSMNIVGTILYMAPDVFSPSRRYTTQVDVWSLGVVLYVMLTGKMPFQCQGQAHPISAEALGSALAAKEVQALPPLPAEVLKKLLVENPTERLTATAAIGHRWFSCTGDGGSDDAILCAASAYQEIEKSMKVAFAVSFPAVSPARGVASLDLEDSNAGQLRHSWHAGVYGPEDCRSRLAYSDPGDLKMFALASMADGSLATFQPISRPQGLTFNEAVVTMIINCVGAGVVLFPKIMADVGMVTAPLLCAICALTCLECGVMITAASSFAEAVLNRPIQTYEELATFSAPFFKPILIVTKNAAFLGFIIAYMQLVVDSIAALLPMPAGAIRFGIVLPFFCFLGMIKDLKQLARFSSLGLMSVVIECGCIMVGGIIIMCQSGTQPEYSVKPTVETSELPGACGKYIAIFLFSFAILGTVPSVRAQLEQPSQMHAVLSRSFMILVFINCTVMTLGYLGFGKRSGENVIVDIANAPGLAWMGKLGSSAVLVNVLLSSPLYIFCVMSLFEASGGGAVRTPMTFPNIAFRISLISALCLIGNFLPYVGEVIGLVSSVFAVCNNIFFPAIFHYKARERAGTFAMHPWARAVKYNVALLVGLCVLVFGFKGSFETLKKKIEDAAAKQNSVDASMAFILTE